MARNPHNLSVHPAQGRQLPRNWREMATVRAAAAEAAYLDFIQNAWKGQRHPNETIPTIRSCRLVCDSAPQPAARLDSELRLVGRTDDGFEIWSDSHGTTIRRRKQ